MNRFSADQVKAELNGHAATVSEQVAPVSKSPKFSIKRLTSSEFAGGDFATAYLINDVLAEGQPLVLAAPLKSMKTTLAVALAISLSLGRSFLNKFWVREAVNVLLLSGESGLSTLQNTGQRIAESYGHDLGQCSRLFWSTDLPRLGNAEHLEAVGDALRRDQIRVLIVDPLYFCLPGQDANNLMVVGDYLRSLSSTCEAAGVTLIVVHHVKKTGIENKHDPPELSQISWAGTAEWARQWILLSRREDYLPGTGEHRLWMVTGGSAGHSGLHAVDICEGIGTQRSWQANVLAPDDVRRQKAEAAADAKAVKDSGKLDATKRAICNALAKFPKGETAKVIRDSSGMDGSTAKRAFAELVQDGSIEPCEIIKRNRKTAYEGYRLRDETST